MSRYIDADELIVFGFDNPDDDHLFEFVPKEFIDNAPTADVVEVVRCKDCKHYKIDHPRANGYHCCYRMHSIFPMKSDGFCNYGERREDAEIH